MCHGRDPNGSWRPGKRACTVPAGRAPGSGPGLRDPGGGRANACRKEETRGADAREASSWASTGSAYRAPRPASRGPLARPPEIHWPPLPSPAYNLRPCPPPLRGALPAGRKPADAS
ncbi:hypothetical protein ScoT_26890 [Streptomyces albidoflavus]|uniref:Uncharacterized protein n=1 Tax=Streptomyces albidoflavus TaxID=1886 RepID=A0AA37BX75_9ACTN|nr:hypothetical protein ScoT_26890 [Streptomyces albidoflavus]